MDDTDIGGPALTRAESQLVAKTKFVNPLFHTLRRPEVNEDCMTDPLVSTFYHDIWHLVAENNTKIYRQVFRCMPDSEVVDWKTYERFNEYSERFMQSQGLGSSNPRQPKDAPGKSGPPGSGGTESGVSSSLSEAVEQMAAAGAVEGRARSKSVLSGFVSKLRSGSKADEVAHTEEMHEEEKEAAKRASPGSPGSGISSEPTAAPSPQPPVQNEKAAQKLADQTDSMGAETAAPDQFDEKQAVKEEDFASVGRQRTIQYSEGVNNAPETTATQSTPIPTTVGPTTSGSQKRRRRGTTKSSARAAPEEVLGREEAEELLKMVQGRLVLWPYEWYVQSVLLSFYG
jgi:phospholipase D1/2